MRLFIEMIFFFLISMFFLYSMEEKVMMCLVFLFYLIMLFSSGDLIGVGVCIDSFSFSMIYLTLVLMMAVFLSVGDEGGKYFFLSLSMVIVVMFFMVDNVFSFFILFELSLVPIFFLISFWGVQPERVGAIKFMMIYTLVASSPLLFFIISLYQSGVNSFSFFFGEKFDYYLIFSSFFAFWVKIPLFFFHSWLPKAHVEAPLEGSMVLAGLMLKVGVYGMVRLISVFPIFFMEDVISFFFCVGILGSLITIIVAISSDDMKMSVAFSSISHMNMCVASLASLKAVSMEAWVFIMISHGLCSPMMFFLVTKVYYYSGSRSLVISKGLISKFPFLQFISFITWGVNISVPPSLSFLGEVNVICSIYSVYLWGSVLVLFYFLFSSFFSMMNYGVQSHSSESIVWKGSLNVTAISTLAMYLYFIIFLHFFFSEVFFV